MPFRHERLIAVLALASLAPILTACAHSPQRIHVTPKAPMTTTTIEPATYDQPRVVARAPIPVDIDDIHLVERAAVLIAAAKNVGAVSPEIKGGRVGRPVPPAAPTTNPSLAPCGGTDYPPCYVAARESGGSYSAYNPGGCGGNGCYGKWQFSGAWAGRLGLPTNLAAATPAQQDAAARALWAHGAGCSNWAACG